MFKKNKISRLDEVCESRAYLETLSDEELLRRAREKSLVKFREKYGEYADEKYMRYEGEEMDIYHARLERRRQGKEKRNNMAYNFWGGVRKIVFTPISTVLNFVSFILELVGKISSLGLIAGVYYLYQSFSALSKGIPFAEIDTFGKAVPFIIFPFIAYGLSVVLGRLYAWSCRMCK